MCRVGPDAADPHGREHWAEMLANPRKPVEHWHQLVEVSGEPPRAPQPAPPSPLHSRDVSRLCGLCDVSLDSNPRSSILGCVTSSKLLDLSVPPFPLLGSGAVNSIYYWDRCEESVR